jgi:hypothetical protein
MIQPPLRYNTTKKWKIEDNVNYLPTKKFIC